MPFAQLLIDLNLLLRAVLLPSADVRLAQPVVRVSKIGVQLQRALVFGNSFSKFTLIGIQIAELQMSFSKRRVRCDRPLQKRLNLSQIEVRILRALSFPQTHRIVVERLSAVRLQLREPPEPFDDFGCLAWRTVVSSCQKLVATLIRRAQIRAAKDRKSTRLNSS